MIWWTLGLHVRWLKNTKNCYQLLTWERSKRTNNVCTVCICVKWTGLGSNIMSFPVGAILVCWNNLGLHHWNEDKDFVYSTTSSMLSETPGLVLPLFSPEHFWMNQAGKQRLGGFIALGAVKNDKGGRNLISGGHFGGLCVKFTSVGVDAYAWKPLGARFLELFEL